MRFPEEINDDVLKRLRRLEGQIRGVQRLVDEGAECREIVHQLAAAKAALDRVGFRLVSAGLRHCGTGDASSKEAAELEKLFMKLS
ncbi:MAG: transcriptional regulator [Actinomyces sp.]|nr:MAG: transcriptional regulator [Actinomyces sp.]